MRKLSRTQEQALHSIAQRNWVDWAAPQTIKSLLRRDLIAVTDPEHPSDTGLRLTAEGLRAYRASRHREFRRARDRAQEEYRLCMQHAERNTVAGGADQVLMEDLAAAIKEADK